MSNEVEDDDMGTPPVGRGPTRTQAVYVISVAAELAGMHPQTLRIYERRGLVSPARTGHVLINKFVASNN